MMPITKRVRTTMFGLKEVLQISARLMILLVVMKEIYYANANIIQSGQKEIASEDRIDQISDQPRVHPYGSSFEAINKGADEPGAALADPMSAAASYYHHHSGGAKGWLDMGAWTKKKGAFGWYADFPVGGKGR